MLFSELAARRVKQEPARVKPVHGPRDAESLGEALRFKVRIVGAPRVPQSVVRRDVREASDLFHSAVAVRGHQQDLSAETTSTSDPYYDVVMKLSLFAMVDELVPIVLFAKRRENRAQGEVFGQPLKRIVSHSFRMTTRPRTATYRCADQKTQTRVRGLPTDAFVTKFLPGERHAAY